MYGHIQSVQHNLIQMEDEDFTAYMLSGIFYASKDFNALHQTIKVAIDKGYIRTELLFKAFAKITKNDDRFADILYCLIHSVIGNDFEAADVLTVMKRISINTTMTKYFPDNMVSAVVSSYPPSEKSLEEIGMKSIMLFFNNNDMVTYLEHVSVNKIVSMVRKLLSKKNFDVPFIIGYIYSRIHEYNISSMLSFETLVTFSTKIAKHSDKNCDYTDLNSIITDKLSEYLVNCDPTNLECNIHNIIFNRGPIEFKQKIMELYEETHGPFVLGETDYSFCYCVYELCWGNVRTDYLLSDRLRDIIPTDDKIDNFVQNIHKSSEICDKKNYISKSDLHRIPEQRNEFIKYATELFDIIKNGDF